MDIKIIPCKEEYLERAIELTYISWEPIFEGYRQELGDEMFNALYSDWKKVKYNRIYNGLTSERGYVALVDGEVAGFVFYITNDEKKIGVVEENAVDMKFRGLGIAGKMYDFVLNKMRDEGMMYSCVKTGLDEAHSPARRAYEKAGFDKSIQSVTYYIKL